MYFFILFFFDFFIPLHFFFFFLRHRRAVVFSVSRIQTSFGTVLAHTCLPRCLFRFSIIIFFSLSIFFVFPLPPSIAHTHTCRLQVYPNASTKKKITYSYSNNTLHASSDGYALKIGFKRSRYFSPRNNKIVLFP